MSEAFASQDFRNLQEKPVTLEMGELRKITTLQDVSLAEGEGTFLRHTNEENERKLKTNSLKRFFRLSNKKKPEEDTLEAEKTELEIEEAPVRKDLAGSFSKSSLKSSLSSYWSSVFKSKKSSKSTKSGQEEGPNADEASSSIKAENYLLQATIKDTQDNAHDSKDTHVLEEIQSLNISEEGSKK